jgi:SRSO17 transposase
MERRFEIRKRKILQEADIKQEVANGMLKRLEQFAQPFIASLGRREPKQNARIYICGLLSDLRRKNVESIAYRYDQDRRALQRFIGCAPWDHQPLLEELARQFGAELGEDNGVIVFDPSAHKKCGNDSVGVQRQWLGRLGKVDNGQVAVYMGYASGKEHALVDTRLYLPKQWAKDKARRKKCGVPKQVRILLYSLLRQACDRRYPGWAIRFTERRNKRRELARFYHYKRHNLLAPLRVKERK